MDSLTDELNSWFNAVRLEDAHDYTSAALAYIGDAAQCLAKRHFVRAAMSVTSAANCLAAFSDIEDAAYLYSAGAQLYELDADVTLGGSIRESLWSLLHSFEYFTLVSDHVSAERVSKKYADLARRVDRFDKPSVFEVLKQRRESVLVARSNLSSSPTGYVPKSIKDTDRIKRAIRSLLQQIQSLTAATRPKPRLQGRGRGLDEEEEDEEGIPYATEDYFAYESEVDTNERRIVS